MPLTPEQLAQLRARGTALLQQRNAEVASTGRDPILDSIPVKPQEDNISLLEAGKQLGLGVVVDIPKTIGSLVANIAQVAVPFVDLKEFEGINELLPGIINKPQSLSEVPGAALEATGLPGIVRRQQELAGPEGSASDVFLRTIGELTVSPLLDLFGFTEIDPDRAAMTKAESFRAFPLAALAAVPAARGAVAVARAGKFIALGKKIPSSKGLFRSDLGEDLVTRIEKGATLTADDLQGPIKQSVAARVMMNPDKILEHPAVKENILTPEAMLDLARSKEVSTVVWRKMIEEPDVPAHKVLANAIREGHVPEADIAAMVERTGMTVAEATEHYTNRLGLAADMIEKTGSIAGKTLETFSEFKEARVALAAMSPDQKVRLAQLSRQLDDGTFTGWIQDTFIQPGLASMVSQPKTSIRNFFEQGNRALIQSFEDTFANMVEHAAKAKRLRYDKKRGLLPEDAKLDLGVIYAETLGNYSAILHTLKDFPTRKWHNTLAAAEEVAYGSKALAAKLAGKPEPPRPANMPTRSIHTFQKIVNEVPTEAMRLYQGPTAELGQMMFAQDAAAVWLGTLKKTIGQPGVGPKLTTLVNEQARAFGQMFGQTVSVLNKAVEIEQRNWFGLARLEANLRRHKTPGGKAYTPDEFLQLIKDPETRPAWAMSAINDSVDYSLYTTYASRPTGGIGGAMLDLYAKVPVMPLLGPPFMRYLVNRYRFLMERTPFSAMQIMGKDMRSKMAGAFDELAYKDKIKTQTEAITLRQTKIQERRTLLENKGKDPGVDPKINALQSEIIDIQRQIPGIRHEFEIAATRDATQAFARGTLGMALVNAAGLIRNSALAGPRFNQLNLGKVDPNNPEAGDDILNVKPFDLLNTFLGLAEAEKALSEGRRLTDVFTGQDLLELSIGIRSLNDSGFVIFDFAREFQGGRELGEHASDLSQRFLGSTIGRLFTAFRTMKDFSALTDLRAAGLEGFDEGFIPDQATEPLLGPAMSNLPRGLQRLVNEVLVNEPEPLPTRGTPFRASGERRVDLPGYNLLGLTITREPKLQRLIESAAMTQSDLVGSHGLPELDNEVARQMGQLMGQPIQGQSFGDVVTDMIISAEKSLAQVTELEGLALRRDVTRRVFADIREQAKKMAYVKVAKENPELLIRKLALDRKTEALREVLKKHFEKRDAERNIQP